ncbi:MAG TPA: hypothetical protein VMV79_08635 [Alphaproteobacteria bacterium]|jgi:hypothetical protein|nr:hypothetical protein [Alphaproteobacteria bacterium]
MGLLRALLMPVIIPFHIARGLWNKSCDWNWPMGVRIVAFLVLFGGLAFLCVWGSFGFPWPLFGK